MIVPRTTALFGVFFCGLLVSSIGFAHALTPQQLIWKLPRVWCGSFVWTPGAPPSSYRVAFRKFTVGDGGKVTATGPGTILSRRHGSIRVIFHARFDPRTYAVRLWETVVPPSPKFYLTSGHFIGVITPDLTRIDAKWVDPKLQLQSTRFRLEAGAASAKYSQCRDTAE